MSFCIYCGDQIGDNDKFCTKCGAPQRKMTAADTVVIDAPESADVVISEGPELTHEEAKKVLEAQQGASKTLDIPEFKVPEGAIDDGSLGDWKPVSFLDDLKEE